MSNRSLFEFRMPCRVDEECDSDCHLSNCRQDFDDNSCALESWPVRLLKRSAIYVADGRMQSKLRIPVKFVSDICDFGSVVVDEPGVGSLLRYYAIVPDMFPVVEE